MSSPFFNEDHEGIREMAREFANKTLAPIAADIDKNEEFPMDWAFWASKFPRSTTGWGSTCAAMSA